MLEFAVLGLLSEGDAHGYEIRRRLAADLGALRVFSYGSLYPLLRRLVTAGLIVEREATDPVADAEPGSRTRRARRVYGVTAAGRLRFAEMADDAGTTGLDDDVFSVYVAFLTRLPVELRIRVLESRRRRVDARRESLRVALRRADARVDRYSRELRELGLESSEREVRWLDGLIAAERADGADPLPP